MENAFFTQRVSIPVKVDGEPVEVSFEPVRIFEAIERAAKEMAQR